jgi:hypothetical protein
MISMGMMGTTTIQLMLAIGNDDGVESYCPTETLMGWYITALKKEISYEEALEVQEQKWLIRHLEASGFIV